MTKKELKTKLLQLEGDLTDERGQHFAIDNKGLAAIMGIIDQYIKDLKRQNLHIYKDVQEVTLSDLKKIKKDYEPTSN